MRPSEFFSAATLALSASCIPSSVPQKIETTSSDIQAKTLTALSGECEKINARPVTGKLNGNNATGCLSYEFDSLAQLQQRCESFHLPDYPNVSFISDLPTYMSKSGPKLVEWICRPIVSAEDRVAPASYCPGKWIFISKGAFDSMHKRHGQSMVPVCLPDRYASITHFIPIKLSRTFSKYRYPSWGNDFRRWKIFNS